ncbi:MAG: ribonuclease III, partial [Nitrososphaerota archaeon]|nr:ribonuclease III [Nitrososphaerota archaeon]
SRAAVVNAVVLAEVAADLGIGPTLLLGKGEEGSGGREKPSILADATEAKTPTPLYISWARLDVQSGTF